MSNCGEIFMNKCTYAYPQNKVKPDYLFKKWGKRTQMKLNVSSSYICQEEGRCRPEQANRSETWLSLLTHITVRIIQIDSPSVVEDLLWLSGALSEITKSTGIVPNYAPHSHCAAEIHKLVMCHIMVLLWKVHFEIKHFSLIFVFFCVATTQIYRWNSKN